MTLLRGSALWGAKEGRTPRGRRLAATRPRLLSIALTATALALLLPGIASSAPNGGGAPIPQALLDALQANPDGSFSVIIQGKSSEQSEGFAGRLSRELAKDQGLKKEPSKPFGGRMRSAFSSINGFAVELSGRDILKLRNKSGILSIGPDSTVTMAGSNPQRWPAAVAADWFLGSTFSRTRAATIAIVDSGIDRLSANVRSRVLKQVDMGGGPAGGDDRGHGTFVAGVAAGDGLYKGVAPDASLVSLDVFDGQGKGKSSDVIRAADWILKYKDAYGIRVANFSLQTSQPSSFLYDPLDRAVERLWQAGVVVVTSAGNYASDGQQSGVLFAPGNDPFVITVGAVDVNGSQGTRDDRNAPWSSYGYTPDGFAKPEVGAPGRYMIEQVPLGAGLLTDFPGNILNAASGLIQLSGTSFAAAVVSGVAANLLGVHPEWTPDQVKGELMLSAVPLGMAAPGSLGVGEVNLRQALLSRAAFSDPPNPNAALEQFLIPDPAGGRLPVFDAQRWMDVASSDPAWNAASWSSASWSSASWSSASWSSASWSSASWSSASWSNAAWNSASWSNAADLDGRGDG
jgi:serine protease AprX